MTKRTKNLLLLAVVGHPALASAQVRSVQVQTPARDFGYLVGDVIAADAILVAAPGTTLDRQSLPVPGPLNAAIELRSIGVTEARGTAGTAIRIHAEYQIFYAPERVSETELPGFDVQLSTGTTRSTAVIPAWPFHVSPLRIMQRSIDDLSELRRNHAIGPFAYRQVGKRFLAAATVAVVAALTLALDRGWLPWWRSVTRPFARAERGIRRLGRVGQTDETAYKELHRAFDETSGHHVFRGDLQSFFESYPRFIPVRDEVEQFFAGSESQFFARDSDRLLARVDVSKLARSLCRLERRR